MADVFSPAGHRGTVTGRGGGGPGGADGPRAHLAD
jgi:hypothetical protein